MEKRSILITLFTILFASFTANSQTSIKTIPALKQRSSYEFSNEWQYLSSDLYLLNSSKFSDLLNDIVHINSGGKRRRKKRNPEKLQSLFIQAQLRNIRFFGGDVVYPIYNFKISQNKEYTTVETGNTEVVRLIDNLPLATTNDVIDAEIKGEAITQNNANRFLKVIALQLQNLAKLSTPNVAILDLIGEMGKYIESRTTGKQYKFSSTIRLYEGQDFDRRLHSVNVFVFVPSTITEMEIHGNGLKTYVDTSSNPILNKKKLTRLIPFKKYPMIVIANYKSRYNSQLAVGDQINFDYLNKRKLKIEDARKNELINKTSYDQELKLIDFLTVFADLKLKINNYKLNKSSDVNSDQSKILFNILRIYRNLLKIRNIRIVQFRNNSEFENEFLPKYEAVISSAGLYLNAQNTLTNVKNIGEFMENPNRNKIIKKKGEEEILRLLYSIKIPDTEKNSEQAKDLRRLIYDIESNLYDQEYVPIIIDLKALETNEAGLQEKERIENIAGNTYCQKCKTELAKALENYNKRYRENERNKLIQENETIKQQAMGVLFKVLDNKKSIESKLAADSTSNVNGLITMELKKLDNIINKTGETLKTDNNKLNMEELKEQNFMLLAYIKRLTNGFETLMQHIK